MSLRVLMVCPEYPPNSIGGGGSVFGALVRTLPAHDVGLDVLAGNYKGGAARHQYGTANVIEVPLVATPAPLPFLRTTLPPTRAGLRAIDQVLRKRYDVAHLHGVSFALIDILAHRLRRAGIPWVFTLHGAPRTPERLGFPINRVYAAYLRGYGGTAMRDAAVRTAVSRAACDYPLVAPQFHDVRIIHNGIFRDEYAADALEAPIPGWPAAVKNIILSIGRVERTKAFDVGVRALAQLPSDSAYVVLGQDCGEAQSLHGLAQRLGVADRFLTLGHVDLPQKRFALRRAAACWIPSLNESFGLVALEAMASGVPVVTSGAEGLREIFTGDLASCIVSGPDPGSYAGLTKRFITGSAEREAIVESGRKRVLDFDWNRLSQAYASAYRDALQMNNAS